MKNKLLLAIVLVFIAVAMANLAVAAPPNPEYYWGYVYVETSLAQNGTNLTVKTALGELLANLTLPYNNTGSYYIGILFDNPGTNNTDEGADINESIIWYLDGIPALYPSNDIAEVGKINYINITGFRNPNITASLSYLTDFVIGDLLELNVTLDNNGQGSGTGDLSFNSQSKQLHVTAGGENETSFNDTLEACGGISRNLTVEVLNFANSTVSTTVHNISYTVTGPDLDVNLTVKSTASEGDSVAITAKVTNVGTLNISGYNLTITENSNQLIRTEYNDTLEPGQTKNLTYYWRATSGKHEVAAIAQTATTQCFTSNDEEIKNITVASSGGGGHGGGGSGGAGTSSATGAAVAGPRIFIIYNFPKELYDLILGDRIKFELNNDWNVMELLKMSSSSVQLDVMGNETFFKLDNEKEFTVDSYKLFVKLIELVGGKAGFRFDLVEMPKLEADIEINDSFMPGKNVSFAVDFNVNKDTIAEEKIYLGEEVVWENNRTLTEPKKFEEFVGMLEQGEYTLKINLTSGTNAKEFEKKFTVAEPQKPMPVKRTLEDWLMIALILLFAYSLYLSIDVLTHRGEPVHETKPVIRPEPKQKSRISRLAEGIVLGLSNLKKKEDNAEDNAEDAGQIIEQGKKATELRNKEIFAKRQAMEGGHEPGGFRTPDTKEDVYLPYSHLYELKKFIEEFHKDEKITDEISRMPSFIQKLGLDVYYFPKPVSPTESMKMNRLFKEKHDYISYNDLVLGGSLVTRQLKGNFSSDAKPNPNKGKQAVKCFKIEKVKDVNKAIDELRNGAIVLIDTGKLKSSTQELKSVVSKLKSTCDAIGGDVAMTSEGKIIATGSNAGIFRK